MLFEFHKYIGQSWYYNLQPVGVDAPYFVDYRKLTDKEIGVLNIDKGYNTEDGCLADAAYQAIQNGIMRSDASCALIIDNNSNKKRRIKLFGNTTVDVNDSSFVNDIDDNYRFVRRFFNPVYAIYILMIRVLGLHNPVREINGFLKARGIKRINLCSRNNYINYKEDYIAFKSKLIDKNPKVTVVIPTLNRYEYLRDVMSDLEKQDYKNFEVIVCDQSEPVDESFYDGWKLDLKLIKQDEKALWLARNRCIKEAKGEYVLLYDDDSLVDDDWISQHLKCLDYFKCDISSGVSLSVIGAKVPDSYAYFKWSDQIDTGNVMFRRNMMSMTGMFDRQFEKQRQGDGEYGLRCYLLGCTNISNNFAKRVHLKVATGGLRQIGSWDGFRPKKLFGPRPVPSVLYLVRKYFGNHKARLMLLISTPGSIVPYKYKRSKVLKYFAYIGIVFVFPFVFIQVCVSWREASRKLRDGDRIEFLTDRVNLD